MKVESTLLMTVRVGFDIGGTFTDFVVIDDSSGKVIQEKVPTTPQAFANGVIDGITSLQENGLDPELIVYLAHGTTVATNAMLEREGATTGLITTKGFEDIVAIGREKRHKLYDLSPEKPPTFTQRQHRIGVPERVMKDGTVREPLDEREALDAIRSLENEVESIAVTLLHSFRNPDHEKRIKALIEGETDLPVSLSSEVMPEIKEYERTITTIINAYVAPIVESYISTLESKLADIGIDATLHIMKANGGLGVPEHIDNRAIQLINSGPAAGVIGASKFAEMSGITDLITLDVGGTSADAGIIHGSSPEYTNEGEIGDIQLQFKQVDVRTVGAGGGSIAYLDNTGVLKVGPKSAGSDPGPACYGRGGNQPTVTDAAVTLGYIDKSTFKGKKISLDPEAANAVIEELAENAGLNPTRLASGVIDLAANNMAQTVRLVSVEQGYDPRDFSLMAYGGAGPMFATEVAKSIGMETVIIPRLPGVLSASGLLSADRRYDFSKSRTVPLHPSEIETVRDVFDDLIEQARTVTGPDGEIERSVDVRYKGQTFHLTVPVPNSTIDESVLNEVSDRFRQKYEDVYGYSWDDKSLEAITWRIQALVPNEKLELPSLPSQGSVNQAKVSSRRVSVGDERIVDVPVYDRYTLPTDSSLSGPAIIEESESTTVIPDEYLVRIDDTGNLLIDLGS